MIKPSHYVPVLKTRPAEFRAIQMLNANSKANLTPLFELMPLSNDDESEFFALVDQFCSKVLSALGTSTPFFLDLLWMGDTLTINGKHHVEYVFEKIRSVGLQGVPVTGPNRNFAYQNAVKNVIQRDHHGLCVRLQDDDTRMIGSLNAFVSLLGSAEADTDIVIDLGSISSRQTNVLTASVISYLFSMPNITSWRTIVLTGSSYPASGISPRQLTTIKRVEWEIWESLYKQRASLPRLPIFGDYGVDNPALPPAFDATKMSLGAGIRYTTHANYLVFKGGAIKKYGSQQYYSLAQQVVQHPAYMGPQFSWGDAQIDAYARRIPAKGGSAAGWRVISYNHHLTLVTDQLANFSWP